MKGISTIENNLRLPGQYYDRETGLHYNYFRDYDPATGRYVEADPIGLAGGMNVYLYANAAPTIYTDPTGEFFGVPGAIAGAIIGGIGGGLGAAATGGNTLTGIGAGALVGGFVGGFGPLIGPSLLGQSLLRAASGAAGNLAGQGVNIVNSVGDPCNEILPFNWGSFTGSAIGGLAGGYFAPASWGVAFTGALGSQVAQRATAGITGAGISGSVGMAGTLLGKPNSQSQCGCTK